VGREAETAELRRLVTAEQLTTLVGPGGVGKTRLAAQVARQVRADWSGGVFFVDLASLRDPDLVSTRLAEVVGIPEQPGRPTIDYIVDAFESRRLLIVLDNCEQLLDACAALSDALLQSCPDLSLLATSREPLGVEGERLFRLSPLATPEPTSSENLALIAEADAVRLFVERGALQRPGFQLDKSTAGTVAAICRALDGIPLAIELAAARLRSMSLFEIESRLADRFALLTGGNRTASKRHQTLRSLIDWSYQLLEPPEQVMLQRLSVFAGGWTLGIAEEVCGDGRLPRERIAETLGALVDKSLVEVETTGRVTRYRLLETIRHYAAERLSESGETLQVSASHAGAYLSLVEQAAPMLRTSAQADWLVRLDADIGNIRVASDTFRATADRTEDLLRLVAAQRWYWDIRGRYQEGIDLAQTALASAGPSHRAQLRDEALLCLLRLKTWSGELAGMEHPIEETLGLVRSSGDEATLSEVLSLGLYWRFIRGESGAGLASMAEESIACARRSGDQHTLGRVLAIASIGLLPRDAVFAGHQEAVDIFRSIGDRHWLGVALNNLASVEIDAGMVVPARAHLQEAVGIVTQFLGDSSMLAMLILNSGTLAVLEGDLAAAARHFAESFGMAERVGSRSVRAISIGCGSSGVTMRRVG
jgi:predicted ATPase